MFIRVRDLAVLLGIGLPGLAGAQPNPLARAAMAGAGAPAPVLATTPPLSAGFYQPSAPALMPGMIRPDSLPEPSAPPDPVAVEALRADMRAAVGRALLPDMPASTGKSLEAAQAMLDRLGYRADTPQAVLVVDRSPHVQRLWVALAGPGSSALQPLGAVKVSTGKPGRKEHFRTPVGVFDDDASILGYRALGTYNENHIRGVGTKGMRVWDLGWQTTDDWRKPHVLTAVRLEMHATDPDVLERRLGRRDSEGCIRIPSQFNSFLDQSGLLDAKERDAARTDRRFAALLPRNAAPNALAGHLLVVVDTSDPDAAPSDPIRAAAMTHSGGRGPEHDDAG